MTILSNSQRLRRKAELVLPQLMSAGHALTSHPDLKELYPEYLVTMHGMIRASVPLMEAAVGRAHTLAFAAHDPVAAGFAAYLSQHIREEMHHDEWLLDDLAVLGLDRADVLRRPPSATVAALVGSQYYWIFHYHPVALLGYIAIMEGYPPSTAQIDALVAATGYPRDAFRTLQKHAVLDPHHRDDLDAALDSLPLTPEHTSIIGVSMMQTVYLTSQALREVVEAQARKVAS